MTSRICKTCKLDLPLDAFELTRKPNGLEGRRGACKACRSLSRKPNAKEYRAKNTEKLKADQAAWREANRDKYRAIHQSWRDRNRALVRSSHRAYHANNALRMVLKARKREADQLCATPPWADHSRIAEIYAFAKEFRDAGIDVHVDHVVPLRSSVVCGLHVETNLRVLLAAHNLRKSNKMEEAGCAY